METTDAVDLPRRRNEGVNFERKARKMFLIGTSVCGFHGRVFLRVFRLLLVRASVHASFDVHAESFYSWLRRHRAFETMCKSTGTSSSVSGWTGGL